MPPSASHFCLPLVSLSCRWYCGRGPRRTKVSPYRNSRRVWVVCVFVVSKQARSVWVPYVLRRTTFSSHPHTIRRVVLVMTVEIGSIVTIEAVFVFIFILFLFYVVFFATTFRSNPYWYLFLYLYLYLYLKLYSTTSSFPSCSQHRN